MHKSAFLSLLLVFALPALGTETTNPPSEDDFLLPDQAFQLSGRETDRGQVVINWNIAKGYYLYQSKFKFTSDNPSIRLGTPVFPDSETKHDEFFGEMEVYRNQVAIQIPVTRPLGDLVVPIRKPSVDATSDVLGEIDFLFIDGSHDYDDVAADFATWFPRVRPGGLIAFHDSWHMSGVRRASGEILRVSRDIAEPSLVDTITFLRKVDGNGRKDRIQNRMFVVKRNVFGLPGFLRLTYRGTRLQRDT